MARPKDQQGNYDVSPLKSFEMPEPKSESDSSTQGSPRLATSSAAVTPAVLNMAMLPTENKKSSSSQIATGSEIVFKMSTSSAGAGVIFVFFMLYSSVPLLLISPQANAGALGAIRASIAVGMSVLQQWPLRTAGMPHLVKFCCCVLAFALVGTLVAGKGVNTGPGAGADSNTDGISEETVVHLLMIVIHIVCSAPKHIGLGRIGILSCLILMDLKNYYVDGDMDARPHFGRSFWLALAFLSSSYAAVVNLLS